MSIIAIPVENRRWITCLGLFLFLHFSCHQKCPVFKLPSDRSGNEQNAKRSCRSSTALFSPMFELCYVHGEHTRRIVRIVNKRFRHVSCPDNSKAIGRVINYLSEITNDRSRLTGPHLQPQPQVGPALNRGFLLELITDRRRSVDDVRLIIRRLFLVKNVGDHRSAGR